MRFDFRKWRDLEARRALIEKYGENSNILSRLKMIKKTPEGKHSFPHLLNKHYTVKRYSINKRPA